MAQTSFALLTNTGRAKEAAALANATSIEITHIAIGDGATVPSGGETALYNEVARKTIAGHGTVVGAENVAYFDCYLAAGDGPYTIREAGLYDVAGDLIAIAHYDPPINKPVPASGQTVEGTVRLEVAFSNIATVVIKVDPSMQVALQRLTRLPWVPVIELGRNDPPAGPAAGDAYVIGSAPTGAWTGHAGKLAEYTIAGWSIMVPPAGHGVSLPDGRVFERIGGSYIEKIALDVQAGKWQYAAVAGTANAILVTLSPVPAGYTAGMVVRFKVASGNTGPVTINVNGLGAKSIRRADGDELKSGDLVAGGVATLAYDGASFQLVAAGISAASVPSRDLVIFAVPGTTNWTVPAGVTRVWAEGWGGGGGGGGTDQNGRTYPPAAGASGAYFAGWFDVTPGEVIPITIGGGGQGTTVGVSSATGGGTTSFGSMASATGGGPGVNANSATGTVLPMPGVAVGGQLNLPGQKPEGTQKAITNGYICGAGASAPRGGPGGPSGSGGGVAGIQPGGGGGHGGSGNGTDTTLGTGPANGAAGGAGMLLLTW